MTEVSQFHNLSHVFISLIGAILLAAIYYNIRKRFRSILEEESAHKRVDKGLLYLSSAMFVWVFSGLWNYIGIQYSFDDSFLYQVGTNIWSIINNMFILLALYYFYNAPSFIYKNEKSIRVIIGIIVIITAITLLVSATLGDKVYHTILLNAVPDLLLSAFLCYLLAISLFRTFQYRDLKLVAYLSVLVVLLVFSSQLPEVFLSIENDFVNNLIKIIAKTSLISIFLVLATTWVIQLANTPTAKEMKLEFLDWSILRLTIPSKNIINETIDFGSRTTQYKNLLKLALRRKYGEGDQQSLIVGSSGEIKNQTYLSRIIDNINDSINLEEDQKLERKDLFTFLGEGRYRLRMIQENIDVDKNLYTEFIGQKENDDYKALFKSHRP